MVDVGEGIVRLLCLLLAVCEWATTLLSPVSHSQTLKVIVHPNLIY